MKFWWHFGLDLLHLHFHHRSESDLDKLFDKKAEALFLLEIYIFIQQNILSAAKIIKNSGAGWQLI